MGGLALGRAVGAPRVDSSKGCLLDARAAPQPSGQDTEWYLFFELLGGVVVNQGHRQGDSVVVMHQREQYPCVGGGSDPSHDFYFPGCFGPNVWGCSSCDEGGASKGHTNEGKMGVSRQHHEQLPALPSRWEAEQ